MFPWAEPTLLQSTSAWIRQVLTLALTSAFCASSASALASPQPTFVWPIPAWMAPPPVPADNPMTPEKVELGRHLFYDARLSADNTVACVSCHVQDRAFTDNRPLAIGINNEIGIRNAPSLANVGYFPFLTWGNPYLDKLEVQALIPIFGDHPIEMGSNGKEQDIFEKLSKDPYYKKAFAQAFTERAQIDLFTITRALAAFQRSLVSVNSPYDRFKYWGESLAISESAKRGEQLFFNHRFECYHCHIGIHLTNNNQTAYSPFREFGAHNTGLYNLDDVGSYPPTAVGLYEFTGERRDMGRFRTPSLRNVAMTAPYFHDGSAATLREVIAHYAKGGRRIDEGPFAGNGARNPHKDALIVGFEASHQEIEDLIAFLESLTDTDFMNNPAYSDPWPSEHPARAQRAMPLLNKSTDGHYQRSKVSLP